MASGQVWRRSLWLEGESSSSSAQEEEEDSYFVLIILFEKRKLRLSGIKRRTL